MKKYHPALSQIFVILFIVLVIKNGKPLLMIIQSFLCIKMKMLQACPLNEMSSTWKLKKSQTEGQVCYSAL
jgi:hypothetical protein